MRNITFIGQIDSTYLFGKGKGFTRKSKSGKWSSVKSFIRKKLKRD